MPPVLLDDRAGAGQVKFHCPDSIQQAGRRIKPVSDRPGHHALLNTTKSGRIRVPHLDRTCLEIPPEEVGISRRRTAEDSPGRLLKAGEVAHALLGGRLLYKLPSETVAADELLGGVGHCASSISRAGRWGGAQRAGVAGGRSPIQSRTASNASSRSSSRSNSCRASGYSISRLSLDPAPAKNSRTAAGSATVSWPAFRQSSGSRNSPARRMTSACTSSVARYHRGVATRWISGSARLSAAIAGSRDIVPSPNPVGTRSHGHARSHTRANACHGAESGVCPR